ncbi:MAG: hypothetical protein GF411_03645 [Candidatus Lokiarchaeota archaeon]|nr:hypothetical protein [Candidatus Lokiarchaeota archaeon]
MRPTLTDCCHFFTVSDINLGLKLVTAGEDIPREEGTEIWKKGDGHLLGMFHLEHENFGLGLIIPDSDTRQKMWHLIVLAVLGFTPFIVFTMILPILLILLEIISLGNLLAFLHPWLSLLTIFSTGSALGAMLLVFYVVPSLNRRTASKALQSIQDQVQYHYSDTILLEIVPDKKILSQNISSRFSQHERTQEIIQIYNPFLNLEKGIDTLVQTIPKERLPDY